MSAGVGTLTLDRLRHEGEAFMEALSREYYEAHAGLKETAELQPIYVRFSSVAGPDSLALARDAFAAAAAGTEEHRSARLLLEWQAEALSMRELAPLDEREIAWESSAVVRLPDGRGIPYQRAAIDIANGTDRADRETIATARARLIEAELAPMKRERFQRERDITERLGIAAGYNETYEILSGVPLGDLRVACEQFLLDTASMWREVYPEFVRRGLGIDPAVATRADAMALFRAREFDAAFPAATLHERVRRQVREMGIDPVASGRIIFDTEEREGKRARAFCAPVRVPAEIYLVQRPFGGQSDWTTLLHELGHALHFAYMRPALPFEFRWLGDNSVTESYAMLFDHRMQDRKWLERYSDLARSRIPAFLRAAGFEELHFLRRYSAKLIYETQLYGGNVRPDSLPELYVELLTGATTFKYDRSEAFVDVDPRYYSTRYLRAWQLQALLADTLVERFDVDWWRNPRAGPWVCAALFAEGQRELASELADRITGRPLSFAPLVRSIERLLG